MWAERRSRAILAALVEQGMSPEAVARQFRVHLRAVLAVRDAAEQRERFAQEHTESGGRARSRTLGRDATGISLR